MEHKKNDKEEKNRHGQPQAEEKPVTIPGAEYAQLLEQAAKAEENWDRFVRLQAEFDNARKRWERERREFGQFANEDLLCNILTVVDELERSVELSQQKHEDYTAFLKGVEMILAHLYEVLRKNGVSCIDAKGKCFDPHCHEALMQVETDEVPENTVVEEMQKGYTLNSRVIRTAKVQVSKKKKKEETKEENEKL